jgi:hypothetical protein
MRLETWGAHRKSKLLARVIGRPVEVVNGRTVLSSDELRTASDES